MTTARDLLTESLPHLSGDTITLCAKYPKPEEYCEPSSDMGFRFVPYVHKSRAYDLDKREYTGGIREYKGNHILYPEAGQARSCTWEDLGGGIVVPINGLRYRVHITVSGGDFGAPDGAVVTFTRTDDKETPYTLFDPQAKADEQVAYLQDNLDHYTALLSKLDSGEYKADDYDMGHIRTAVLEAQLRIENLRSGAEIPQPGGPVTLFGQPCFIQNEITPRTQHEAARHLATLDTGWGDSGNVNIMFACDKDGVPCAAWFEASCA